MSDSSDRPDSELVVAEDQSGALLIGDVAAVARFIEQWQADGVDIIAHTEVTGISKTAAISNAADIAGVGEAVVNYVRRRQVVGAMRGEKVVIRKWVHDGKRIVSNKEINSARLFKAANPTATFGIIAVRAALAQAVDDITDAIDRVEGKTDDLLRLANADRTGDVIGHHRLLNRRVTQLDEGAELTDTDWSTLASLGPTLEVGVERLRAYASRLVGDLPTGLAADDRADRLGRVARQGRLGETLRLLIVAEQSMYLWQRLRVERVQRSEPDHLDQAMSMAHDTLAEHLEADSELVDQLRQVLSEYGMLQPLEFLRKNSGRKLRTHVGELRGDLDYFVRARQIQIGTWDPLVMPTVRDAITVAKTAAVDSGRALRGLGASAVDGGLSGIGKAGGAVQGAAERLRARRGVAHLDPRPEAVEDLNEDEAPP